MRRSETKTKGALTTDLACSCNQLQSRAQKSVLSTKSFIWDDTLRGHFTACDSWKVWTHRFFCALISIFNRLEKWLHTANPRKKSTVYLAATSEWMCLFSTLCNIQCYTKWMTGDLFSFQFQITNSFLVNVEFYILQSGCYHAVVDFINKMSIVHEQHMYRLKHIVTRGCKWCAGHITDSPRLIILCFFCWGLSTLWWAIINNVSAAIYHEIMSSGHVIHNPIASSRHELRAGKSVKEFTHGLLLVHGMTWLIISGMSHLWGQLKLSGRRLLEQPSLYLPTSIAPPPPPTLWIGKGKRCAVRKRKRRGKSAELEQQFLNCGSGIRQWVVAQLGNVYQAAVWVSTAAQSYYWHL